ncbi:hypothetical protein L1987_43892 [Smallanthus sonchifolius]|uniref:Uncharacterized protein n=1 Tax=Smallanthus sonchifolius TaxID=185202 RepID=A0ACB9GN19_9ASTR|nr:hypothetical protein L1987_43892 [Smallanthus sonchifolius]
MVASLKGDTYGFGVVLLELATGQKPTNVTIAEEGCKGNLVDWVNQLSGNCVTKVKARWSMYKVYEALNSMAQEVGLSEDHDEFPLLLDNQNDAI